MPSNKIVLEVPIPQQQSYSWDYANLNLVLGQYRSALSYNTSIYDDATAVSGYWFTNGLTNKTLSTYTPLSINPLDPDSTNAYNVVEKLNIYASLVNDVATGVNGPNFNHNMYWNDDLDVVTAQYPINSVGGGGGVDNNGGPTSLFAISFSAVVVNGKYYLMAMAECSSGTPRGLDENFLFPTAFSIDFRFADPMTRKILGVRSATKILLQPQLSYSSSVVVGTPSIATGIFPDPMDFSSTTQCVTIAGISNGSLASIPSGTLTFSFYSDVSDIPQDSIQAGITINGGAKNPVNVDPVYNWNTVSTYLPNGSNPNSLQSKSPNITKYMSQIPASTSYTFLPALETQTVPNFNGFNSSVVATGNSQFLGHVWNFWPWSNVADMTIAQNTSTYFNLIAPNNLNPECCTFATNIAVFATPKNAKSPTDILEIPNFYPASALLTTGYPDIRFCDLGTGSVTNKTTTSSFLRGGTTSTITNI